MPKRGDTTKTLPQPDETAGRALPHDDIPIGPTDTTNRAPKAEGEGKGDETKGGGGDTKGGGGKDEKPDQGVEEPQPPVGELLTEVEVAHRRRPGRSDPRFGQPYIVRLHIDVWEAAKGQGWLMLEDTTAGGGHVRVEINEQFSDIEATGIDGTSDVMVTITPHTRRHKPEDDRPDKGR